MSEGEVLEDALDANLRNYRAIVVADIETCVSEMGCQLILFVGSGLSKRYISGPSWDELLAELAKRCSLIEKDYAYYKQRFKDPTLIGKEFARLFQEWACGEGKTQFPSEMFASEVSAQSYVKYAISMLLHKITPQTIDHIQDQSIKAEIRELQNIRPHALITTNYDQLLE